MAPKRTHQAALDELEQPTAKRTKQNEPVATDSTTFSSTTKATTSKTPKRPASRAEPPLTRAAAKHARDQAKTAGTVTDTTALPSPPRTKESVSVEPEVESPAPAKARSKVGDKREGKGETRSPPITPAKGGRGTGRGRGGGKGRVKDRRGVSSSSSSTTSASNPPPATPTPTPASTRHVIPEHIRRYLTTPPAENRLIIEETAAREKATERETELRRGMAKWARAERARKRVSVREWEVVMESDGE